MVWPVQIELALVTLANNTALVSSIITLNEDAFFISADLTWVLEDLTATEGPIRVGLANGDLSVTEIVEAITASPSSPDDIIAMERARRPTRHGGTFPGLSSHEALNNGNPLRTTLKMSIGDTTTLNVYAVNESGAGLTTGCILNVFGKIYGRWQR